MNKWEYKTLDQMGSVQRGRSKHRPRNDARLFGGQYPFIQTADVKNAPFYISEYSETYNEVGLAQSKLWDIGTLCITIAANIADTGILAIPACFPDSVLGFRPYNDISDVRFVKYCFDILQKDCKQISQGTAQDNLSWEKLSTIKFPCPSIEEQQKIADVLSAYDDLIENNRNQIKLLEEAAQRLYKEWFIDLRFPGHETTPIVNGIPEGWEKAQLRELIAFNPKIAVTNDTTKTFIPMEALSTSSMVISASAISETSNNAGSKFEISDTLLARITPCLENGKTAFVSNIDKGVYGVGSTEFIVLRSKKLNPYIVYLLARTEEFRNYAINSMTGSDGRQRVKVDKLEMYSTLLPSRSIVDLFGRIVAPYFEKVKVLSKAVHSCQEARDYLLPRLINSELEVK